MPALVLAALLVLAPAPPAAAQDTDSAAALAAFRGNIAAIHARDRAAYLSHYLRSPRLVRVGPAGVQHGYQALAGAPADSWPDTLVASHFQVTPLAPGVVYGAYRYRVATGGDSERGVSERVLVRTPEGWRVAVTTAFAADPTLAPPPFALVGATLVDGTGAAPVADAVVVMRDGRIECAGARAACPVPADADTVDARGRWIIPGLVDAHVHYSQTGWADGRPDALDVRERFPYAETVRALEARPERFFRSHLCAGVTATFDVGGYPWTWDLRQRAETSTSAPHVAAAGPLLSSRDHWVNVPGERQFIPMEGDSATRAGAAYLVANETDAIKVWFLHGESSPGATEAAELLAMIGEEARAAGRPLIVHATGLWQAKQALRAGATLLVHSVYDVPIDEEFLDLMRRSGAVITPTLTVFRGYQQLRERSFDAAAVPLACVDPETRAKAFLTDSLPGRPTSDEVARLRAAAERRYQLMLDNLARIHQAGLPIAMGTDAGNPLTLHGPSISAELEAMEEAGLTPMEVLVAATRNGARAMGRVAELGSVESGKVADLVVLDADPTMSAANLRRVALVVRRGEIWTREELEYPDGQR
ncbi:MAG TPA: amidohydrolase family protein [Longimicrobiales bacterium]|nr:amidohydrolase family protein [Longimicrobiales bacterium]